MKKEHCEIRSLIIMPDQVTYPAANDRHVHIMTYNVTVRTSCTAISYSTAAAQLYQHCNSMRTSVPVYNQLKY